VSPRQRALWSKAWPFEPLKPGKRVYDPRPPEKRAGAGPRPKPDREPGHVESLTHLSPSEAAELLDIERHAVYAAIRRGRLRAEPYGVKGWLISREAVNEYIADRYRRGER